MEEARDDFVALIINWTIDNFRDWNGDIHDPVLTAKDSWFLKEYGLIIELYPRGVSSFDEQLVVRMRGFTGQIFKGKGDLSFIASGGSLLSTRQFNGIQGSGGVLEFPPGPKFLDVVEHIGKKEALHKDQLTLQFRFRHPQGKIEENFQMYINSMIETFETTVKIRLEQLKEMKQSKGMKRLEEMKECFIIEYPLNGGKTVRLVFTMKDSKTAADAIEMRLEAEAVGNKFGVRTLMSILNSDGSELRSEQNEHVFCDKGVWVIPSFLTKEEVSQKGQSVVIDFKIIPSNGHKFLSHHVLEPRNAFEMIPTKTCFHQTPGVLKTDLMRLYKDQDFSYVQLNCGNITFPVNKVILSARSPVFKTMLSSDMTEAASGEVDIWDLDPSTLGLFLTYLYTGSVKEELQCDRALKLYYAADKYQVPSLVKECADFLCANVSIDNVCDILSLAHKHEDDQLRSVSHTFIVKNFNQVLASGQWGSFMRCEPLLAVDTVTQFAKNNRVRGSE